MELNRSPSRNHGYVLVTAARNEERFIEKTIESVVSQTVRPTKWIIVSDASADSTDNIIASYCERYSFIKLKRIERSDARGFASKVYAFNAGIESIRGIEYEFIGNLDADVSFEASYFADLLDQCELDIDLGIVGGYICEMRHGEFAARINNNVRSVAGAVQMFRRQCFDAIGGLRPLRYGGEDWCAEVMARMKGWKVRAFPELRVFHHRPTGAGVGVMKYCYRQGFMDFSLGSHPLFVVCKCLKRFRSKPYVLGAFARLVGFAHACHKNDDRSVAKEVVEFLRTEQKVRLGDLFQMKL